MRECEEIRVFEGVAERTGRMVIFRSARNYPACSSFRDLVRKYNLHGDGVFYLHGRWPGDESSVVLDNVKWIGAERAMRLRRAQDGNAKREPAITREARSRHRR